MGSPGKSAVALEYIAGDVAKQVGLRAKGVEMLDRLVDEQACLFARAFGAEQRKEGLLARIGVLAQLLARGFFVTLDVEQVVGDLEGEADVARIAAQARAPLRRNPAKDRARLDRPGDERAGLERLAAGDGGFLEAP